MKMLGKRLQEQRRAKGATPGEMAEFLGVKLRAYQYYESGGRNPTLENLVLLADHFGVTTDYLLGRTDKER